MKFLLPDKGVPVVDGLAASCKHEIVTKCAFRGVIYIWDLPNTVNKLDGEINEVEVEMLARLPWSRTKSVYMNLGCHKGKSGAFAVLA